jgi:DNA-binding SARP family transcriptional activator/tetratricopeptide (TPR) repeat protein
VEFQILGSLSLRGPAGAVEPAGRLQRVLLGVLLARANEPVGVDVLTDAMWDGRPDDRAPQRLQVHVHKLRRLLDDPARLSYGPSGYRLDVRPAELDATRFADLVGRGVAAESPLRRAELVRQALGQWRGSPFDGLDVPLLADEARRLADRRMAALEVLYEAEVAAGRHTAVVAELAGLVREHPLREKFAALLMIAMYRDGRQAEALEVYRVARDTLVTELGLEPGPELRAVERRILEGGPANEPSAPAQLPSNVTGFVGRAAELSQLDGVLAGAAQVVVIAGTAGVGKTALAVRWSHRLRDRFPDGQLYVDLRGYGPAEPVAPEDALAGFLRALGVEGQSIPADLGERSARFRTLVDGRRMVLVLDNARTVEQVRPLLPGSGTVAVLVTSRDSLAGLVAREGAHRIGLDRLPRAESADLLTRLAGDPGGSVDALVELCARLPLALRVAGELLRSRRGHSVEQLVVELVDEQRRLDLLDSNGDPHTAVRAVFSWSYQNLADVDARLFRLCGVHPGRDVDAYAMAAMTGDGLQDTRRALMALVRAHLLEEVAPGRYQPHDLLRAYAAELAEETDGVTECTAALARLRDFHLYTVGLTGAHVESTDVTAVEVDHPPSAAPRFDSHQDALAWLDRELGNLLAAANGTAPRYAIRLSAALWRYLYIRGDHDDSVALHSLAVRSARVIGDRLAEADALRVLGNAHHRMARGTEVIRVAEQALHLYRELGERFKEAAVLNNIAAVHYEANRFTDVIPLCERAVELLRTSADRRLASTLANLGGVHRTVGNYAAAARCLEEAKALAERLGARNALVYACHGLACLYRETGRLPEALAMGRRTLTMARESGDRSIEGEVIHDLGTIHELLGEHEQALRHQLEALEIARATDDRVLTAMALVGLGRTHLVTGETAAAQARYEDALAIATAGVRPLEEARAHEGLGDVHATLGDQTAARIEWQRALAIFTQLGVPQAADVHAKLTPDSANQEPVSSSAHS